MPDFLFERKTKKDLEELEEIVVAEEENDAHKIHFNLDKEIVFHGKLYQISRNETLQRFQHLLLSALEYVHFRNKPRKFDYRYSSGKFVTRRMLMENIKVGNPETCRNTMRQHLEPHFDSIFKKCKNRFKMFFRFLAAFLLSTSIISCESGNEKEKGGKKLNEENYTFSHRIPAGENSWISSDRETADNVIQKDGIQHWKEENIQIKSYFRVNATGTLNLGFNSKSVDGPARLKINFNGETETVTVDNSEFEQIPIGTFEIGEEGYKSIEIVPLEKSGGFFPVINEILLGGPATQRGINFVEDNFHFGRRGPSVHLRYEVPKDKEVVWFYNEIEVPKGEDVIGSYFMANGFSQGYFGMQVNSETERRILFSVWSPYETQNPAEIPEGYQIKLLKKGNGVTTGKFGNEGSGGQSYKVFDWKSGNTYKFLLKGRPNGDNSTDFTAYFFAPEVGEWELIASFNRPHTDSYLTSLYSFLENFVPATGDASRKAFYKNQWIYDTEGQWNELTKAEFTADATANAGHRLDYAGGVEGESFYMKNCGFFDEYTKMNSFFEREASQEEPVVDFRSLP